MPEADYSWLPRGEILDFSELCRLASCFSRLGARRIRLTGGEPLLRKELPTLLAMLCERAQPTDLALTTNGVLLEALAQPLRKAGLQRITVSLDTLDASRFAAITRRDELDRVFSGIEAARRAGFDELKIDTVVVRGQNDDELLSLLDYASDIGAELRFIEYMDVGGATRWRPEEVVSRDEILETIAAAHGMPRPLPGRGTAPAERFSLPDGTVFGIVASATTPFCQACDRSRITADGSWYRCLYATVGTDLKTPLRAGASDDELCEIIDSGWRARADRGAEERRLLEDRGAFVPVSALRRQPHLEMHTRGG
jgi:cyclic pyranopterin phosphate synthase